MTDDPHPIAVIGSGLAGYTLAREIRRLNVDFPVTVITADDGGYYSKPQLSTALTYQKSPEQLILIPKEKFARQFNLNIIANTHLNAENLNNYINTHQKIILACGAKPIILSCFEKSFPKIHYVNNLQDYFSFRKALEQTRSVLIIGSGLVGCEFANDLINTGYKVSVISLDAYPLARLIPEPIGLALKKALELKGVEFRSDEFFNFEAAQIFNQSNSPVILNAAGIQPDISLALLLGLKTNQGIIANQYLETSRKNIYTLGDCAEINGKILAYIAPLTLGARALAKTLLGKLTPVVYPPMPIYVKTPAYPIVILLPDKVLLETGQWQIEKSANNCRALFYTPDNQLKGFILGGNFAGETQEWLKKLII